MLIIRHLKFVYFVQNARLLGVKVGGKKNPNKYRGGASDATSLFMIHCITDCDVI